VLAVAEKLYIMSIFAAELKFQNSGKRRLTGDKLS